MEPAILGCPICYQLLEEPKFLLCGHGFCLSCIDSALFHKSECPVCREPVEGQGQLKRVYVVEDTVRKIRAFVADKNEKMIVANQETETVKEENKALRQEIEELKRKLEDAEERTEEAYASLRKKRLRLKTFKDLIARSVKSINDSDDDVIVG